MLPIRRVQWKKTVKDNMILLTNAFCFLQRKMQNWTGDQGLLQAFFHAPLHLCIQLPVIPTGSLFVKTVFALETVLVKGKTNLKALVKLHLQELI